MGMGVSLLLIAVGAVLVWAVNATVSGIEIHTIGWILLAVGATLLASRSITCCSANQPATTRLRRPMGCSVRALEPGRRSHSIRNARKFMMRGSRSVARPPW